MKLMNRISNAVEELQCMVVDQCTDLCMGAHQVGLL